MKKLSIVLLFMMLMGVGVAARLVWDPSPTPDVTYTVHEGPEPWEFDKITDVGTALYLDLEEGWPAIGYYAATATTTTGTPKESGFSNMLRVEKLYQAEVLPNSTATMVIETEAGTQEIQLGGEGTYSFYVFSSEAAQGEVEPPGGVGAGGS